MYDFWDFLILVALIGVVIGCGMIIHNHRKKRKEEAIKPAQEDLDSLLWQRIPQTAGKTPPPPHLASMVAPEYRKTIKPSRLAKRPAYEAPRRRTEPPATTPQGGNDFLTGALTGALVSEVFRSHSSDPTPDYSGGGGSFGGGGASGNWDSGSDRSSSSDSSSSYSSSDSGSSSSDSGSSGDGGGSD